MERAGVSDQGNLGTEIPTFKSVGGTNRQTSEETTRTDGQPESIFSTTGSWDAGPGVESCDGGNDDGSKRSKWCSVRRRRGPRSAAAAICDLPSSRSATAATSSRTS
mmetsp:Transcript_21979/g.34139  ORF Transcript_21979/g.34139 Transcript_21979/m.34139 type:complete len:107 (+) Transcript_21979:158-478(+)